MRKGAKRLNYADRQRIESMKKSGAKVTEIARAVGAVSYTHLDVYKRQAVSSRESRERQRICV